MKKVTDLNKGDICYCLDEYGVVSKMYVNHITMKSKSEFDVRLVSKTFDIITVNMEKHNTVFDYEKVNISFFGDEKIRYVVFLNKEEVIGHLNEITENINNSIKLLS